jgi:hypothetical protein
VILELPNHDSRNATNDKGDARLVRFGTHHLRQSSSRDWNDQRETLSHYFATRGICGLRRLHRVCYLRVAAGDGDRENAGAANGVAVNAF